MTQGQVDKMPQVPLNTTSLLLTRGNKWGTARLSWNTRQGDEPCTNKQQLKSGSQSTFIEVFFQCKHFCRIFCFRIVLSSTKITFTTTNFFKAIVIFCQNTLWKLFVKGECLPFVNFGICIRFVGNWHMIVKILNHVCQTENGKDTVND